jgi:hypothetical protein
VLLTDLSANDGKIWGFNASPRRRANMLRQLSEVRERIARGELPTVDGVIPVVVTFMISTVTPRDIPRIPADPPRQRRRGVRLADKAFYDDHAALQKAALARTVQQVRSRCSCRASGTGSGITTRTEAGSNM